MNSPCKVKSFALSNYFNIVDPARIRESESQRGRKPERQRGREAERQSF
jgi:hypothetical protein